MFGQITALLTEIRDAIKYSNDMATAWTSQQTQWRTEDVQRRQDEDSTMKRYIAAMEEANKQVAQPIDKQAIHNEVERERKAAARANNKKNANTNAMTEETPTNG